jgi:hypothetical protein
MTVHKVLTQLSALRGRVEAGTRGGARDRLVVEAERYLMEVEEDNADEDVLEAAKEGVSAAKAMAAAVSKRKAGGGLRQRLERAAAVAADPAEAVKMRAAADALVTPDVWMSPENAAAKATSEGRRGADASKRAKELVDGLGGGYNITHRYRKKSDQLYLQVYKVGAQPSITADYDKEGWKAAAIAVCWEWKDKV